MKKVALPKPSMPEQAAQIKIAAIVFVVVLSGVAGFVGGWFGSSSKFKNLNQTQQKEVVASQSELITSIARDVSPSVVSVNTVTSTTQMNFFGQTFGGESKGAGTGFIVSSDGVIVTNRHVVPEGTSQVSVVLSDGTELTDVEVLGRTNSNDSLDIAFLKIKDAKGHALTPAKLGNSSDMEVGDMVVAIGNALGQFQNTVTTGIISGYGRDVQARGSGTDAENLQDLFQTDAAINQGNSGGPLVNVNGEVIGINTAVAGNAQNIGFAIPINDVTSMIQSVLKTGKLERPYLGVRYVSITDDYANVYNLPVKRGAYILPDTNGQSSILPNSPAAGAGLQPKDIIIKINDTSVDENNNLSSILGRLQVGQKATLTVLRDGKQQTVDVMLQAAPQN